MNEKIKEYVKKYNGKKGYGIEKKDIIETITQSDVLYEEVIEERRHWNDTFRVCEIDGLMIGYAFADTTGDMSPKEVGWEFDPSSICEVVKEEVVKTIYKPRGLK